MPSQSRGFISIRPTSPLCRARFSYGRPTVARRRPRHATTSCGQVWTDCHNMLEKMWTRPQNRQNWGNSN